MTDGTKKLTELITAEEFRQLIDMPPSRQTEWVRERINPDAVGVDRVTAEGGNDTPPEFGVTYYVEAKANGSHTLTTDTFGADLACVDRSTLRALCDCIDRLTDPHAGAAIDPQGDDIQRAKDLAREVRPEDRP